MPPISPAMSSRATSDAEPAALDGLPHVAIIMDGNGRWAERRGMPRVMGHRAGVEAVRGIIRAALECGLSHLTLFSFSSENWSRPKAEVDAILALLRRYIRSDLAELKSHNVRIRIIGRRDNVPSDVLSSIVEAEGSTRDNTGLNLTVAFNYGGRDEIARAAKRMADDVLAGQLSADDLCEAELEKRLDTAELPALDLLIRTSGEARISNFLLWQIAYAEMFFTETLWPDFTAQDFHDALNAYAGRERRFGGLLQRAGSV